MTETHGYYTIEEHAAAKKTLDKEIREDNYLVVTVNYYDFILPYKEGKLFLDALQAAEEYKNSYKDGESNQVITPLPDNYIVAKIISKQAYQATKMAKLLGITYSQYIKSRTVVQPAGETLKETS